MVANDLEHDQDVLFGRQYAAAGIHSMAVLPLLVLDKAIGVLVLHTGRREFFDPTGLKLLMELAGNIAFACDYIDQQNRLEYLAFYDALTGLANRRLFLDRMTQYVGIAAADKHKLAVFLIDLERFKGINDSLGREAGDSLLRQVAQWLVDRGGDAMAVARVGIDLFALVLPRVRNDGEVSATLESTIGAFLNHPFQLDGTPYRFAAKVGVAMFPDHGLDAATLIKHAEAALKKTKASGDRYLFYVDRMSETFSGRLGLENQLRYALDHEEFLLHYQPKFELGSGRLTGAEALIRWNRPDSGLMAPARFIPILEQTGLIHAVGRWALRTAIGEYLRWRSLGFTAAPIAVNVSPLQLRDRGFVAEIAQAISADAHAAAGLELELTESLIMEDTSHSVATLQALRAMGIRIAIDDFGTGFSSLSYLSKLPIDILKIDRSFVLELAGRADGATLVSVIINLAHALKLKAVAEGVESHSQLAQLRALGCDEMQGFLCGQPVPGEVFERLYLAAPPALTYV
jgi:diguanylate cyclase (GGDEF)-like protein